MAQFHGWDEHPSALRCGICDRLDFPDRSSPSYTEMVKKLATVVQAPVDVIGEAERTEIGRREHCHHEGEPVERRRKRAFGSPSVLFMIQVRKAHLPTAQEVERFFDCPFGAGNQWMCRTYMETYIRRDVEPAKSNHSVRPNQEVS